MNPPENAAFFSTYIFPLITLLLGGGISILTVFVQARQGKRAAKLNFAYRLAERRILAFERIIGILDGFLRMGTRDLDPESRRPEFVSDTKQFVIETCFMPKDLGNKAFGLASECMSKYSENKEKSVREIFLEFVPRFSELREEIKNYINSHLNILE